MSPRALDTGELGSYRRPYLSSSAPMLGFHTYNWLASSPSCASVGILDTPPHYFTAPAQSSLSHSQYFIPSLPSATAASHSAFVIGVGVNGAV